MSSLGVAIVGCRAVAPLHAEAIVRADGAHLAVLCDVDPEPAAVLSRRYGGDVVTSFDDVLTRSDVAIVDLVTPDELHASMAIAAADAGKHALVEKPIAMNLSELEEIMAASARNRVRIMCAQSMRFRAKSRRVDKIVRSGEIGDPVFVRNLESVESILDAGSLEKVSPSHVAPRGVAAGPQRHASVRLPVAAARLLSGRGVLH